MPRQNLPAGHWKDRGNVVAALERVREELGHFPTQRELHVRKLGSVVFAANNYHGGFEALRIELGYPAFVKAPAPRRPYGYFRDRTNIERELRACAEKLGRFPSETDLYAEGLSAIIHAAVAHHGGLAALREQMGFAVVRVVRGHWDDVANVDAALLEAHTRLGRCPTEADLEELGYPSLPSVIQKRYGGLQVCYKRLGFVAAERPKRYWSQWENVEKEICLVMKELGRFPVSEDLKERGLTGLLRSIAKNFGGIDAVRERMGVEAPMNSMLYWTEERVLTTVRAIAAEIGYMPLAKQLTERKLGILRNLINTSYGGFAKLRQRLGLPAQPRPKNKWTDRAYFEAELRVFVEKLGHFPEEKDFEQHGTQALYSAVKRFYGGLQRVHAEFFPATAKPVLERVTDWTQAEGILRGAMQQLGHFPEGKELDGAWNWSLAKFIAENGGMAEARRRVGVEPGRHLNGHWRDFANVEAAINEMILVLGRFPHQPDFQKLGYAGLPTSMGSYHGGLLAVRARMGYGPVTEQCIEQHADALARIVIALRVTDTSVLWAKIRTQWIAKDLNDAVEQFLAEGVLTRFLALVDD